jgi:hypothetical protein
VINLTTIRELLEEGFPQYAEKVLKERGGQTPLCCFTREGSMMTCSWLDKLCPIKEFETLCLKCQKEMLEKISQKIQAP